MSLSHLTRHELAKIVEDLQKEVSCLKNRVSKLEETQKKPSKVTTKKSPKKPRWQD